MESTFASQLRWNQPGKTYARIRQALRRYCGVVFEIGKWVDTSFAANIPFLRILLILSAWKNDWSSSWMAVNMLVRLKRMNGGQNSSNRKDFGVVRFWNNEVLGNTEAVLERILALLN